MSKMINIQAYIQAYLESKHTRVYFEEPPKKPTYPYVVYDLPNSVDDGSLENFVLDVDGWDDNQDTTALETIMAAIDGDGKKLNPSGLHRKTIIIPDVLSITFYRENRLALRDEDPSIRRRKIIYQARTYEGG